MDMGQEVRIKRGPRKGHYGIIVEEPRPGWFVVNFGGEDMTRAFVFSSEELDAVTITKRVDEGSSHVLRRMW